MWIPLLSASLLLAILYTFCLIVEKIENAVSFYTLHGQFKFKTAIITSCTTPHYTLCSLPPLTFPFLLQDTLDFIAYVAKDSRYGRACFVLECGGGLAQDVITTIGQAFELRFKEYLKRTPSVQYTSVKSDK